MPMYLKVRNLNMREVRKTYSGEAHWVGVLSALNKPVLITLPTLLCHS